MKAWPKHPVIYEINTWVWLGELEGIHKRPVTLATVPAEEWDRLAGFGFDVIWLMGVWERSPAGIAISLQNSGLLEDFKRALPDFTAADNVGSPYCVRRYRVDERLGGPEGLAMARNMLRQRGIRLILDFVPNHIAPDHPWVSEHPEYLIQGDSADLLHNPSAFLSMGDKVFACGRDPFFPAWPDVMQLNAFDPGLRTAMIETVREIAAQCDGIRCDMAMLMLNNIFARTWGDRAVINPTEDFWSMLIPAVKTSQADFLFLAEAYWDLEWELQQQGFDFCYDKKLYDRMEQGDAESARLHLHADSFYQNKMVRFIENHDEPRAAAAFPDGKAKASAVAVFTLPGARLIHEGQLEGRKVRLPVFLARRPFEAVNLELMAFYRRLLRAIDHDVFRSGSWQLCSLLGWPDNQSCQNLFACCWDNHEERRLIIVNFSPTTSQACVQVPWADLRGKMWSLLDLLEGISYQRSGDEMVNAGLYVELGPWEFHFFQMGSDHA